MKFAQKCKHINVTIKTKGNDRYFDYVRNIAKKYGFTKINNLKIINTGTPYKLIEKASFVGGLISSVLIEAMIAKRHIFMPNH